MVHQNHPKVIEMYEHQEWGVIPCAESNAEFGARVARGLNSIIENTRIRWSPSW